MAVTDPVFIVAELGANAARSLGHSRLLIDLAAAAGADAIKTQCFTAEDMALPGPVAGPGPWEGRALFDLYCECAMPMDWHAPLMEHAESLGLEYFSTPFQPWHVDFLETLGVKRYKVASFEIDHMPLLERIAATGKPCMYSLGTAVPGEDWRAYKRLGGGAEPTDPYPLFCVSSYPASPETYPMDAMREAADMWDLFGLSDHTLGHTIAVAATALGACTIEKHFCIDRTDATPDAAFSANVAEFAAMVAAVRTVEQALQPSPEPDPSPYRRGLWVTADAKAGDMITANNVGILRPAAELTPVDWDGVEGACFGRDVKRGEMLRGEDVGDG